MIKFLTATILICSLIYVRAQSDKPRQEMVEPAKVYHSPGVYKQDLLMRWIERIEDTPKVKYQYVFKMIVDIDVWEMASDTINMVFDNFGKSMSVDQAQAHKDLYQRQINKIKWFIDSIKIPEPQKPKK